MSGGGLLASVPAARLRAVIREVERRIMAGMGGAKSTTIMCRSCSAVPIAGGVGRHHSGCAIRPLLDLRAELAPEPPARDPQPEAKPAT